MCHSPAQKPEPLLNPFRIKSKLIFIFKALFNLIPNVPMPFLCPLIPYPAPFRLICSVVLNHCMLLTCIMLFSWNTQPLCLS